MLMPWRVELSSQDEKPGEPSSTYFWLVDVNNQSTDSFLLSYMPDKEWYRYLYFFIRIEGSDVIVLYGAFVKTPRQYVVKTKTESDPTSHLYQ
jgi:hypothetical protein